MATIRKRGGKWQIQVRRKGAPKVSRTFLLRADAQTWARQMEVEADRHDFPSDPKKLKRITVRDIIERYRDCVVVKKRCREAETIMLNALLRRPFAGLSLAEVTPSVFSDYRDTRLKAVKAATVRRDLGLLHHAFEVARKEWAIPLRFNPVGNVKQPVADRPRDRRLTDSELDRLLAGCHACRNKLVKPLITFALETAMRRGEMLSIRWPDVDVVRSLLRIEKTKNGHPRVIPLSPNAIEVLRTIPRSDEGRVFPLTVEAVKLAWRRLVRRSGVSDLHFHDLRHEAISRFFERGLSVPEVALISGHRDVRQLFRYTHLRPEDVAKKLG